MFRSGLLRVQCQVSFYLLIALWSRLRAPTDCLNRWLKVRYRIRKSFFCTALLSVLLLQHSVGQIIRPLASVCVSVIAVAITESNLTKLCTVVWGRKIKIKFVRGSKSDNALPVFYPQFSPVKCISMGRSKHCSIVAVDWLWWFTRRPSAAARGASLKNGITPKCSSKTPQNCIQCNYNGNMLM